MTTGNTSYNYMVNVPNPIPGGNPVLVGPSGGKSWSGGDSIKAVTPRSTYRTGQISAREQRRMMPDVTFGEIAARRRSEREQKARERKTAKAQKRLLRTQLPPNNYTMERYVVNQGGVLTVSSGVATVRAGVSGTGMYTGYDDPAKYYQTVALLQDSFYGSGFAPGVFLAEGRQALGMISSSATRVRLALRALVRFNPRGVLNALGISAPSSKWVVDVKRARQVFEKNLGGSTSTFGRHELIQRDGTTFKALSSLWLEVNYGWLPLLQDAEAGAQWLAYAITQTTLRRRVKVSKSWKYTATLDKGQYSPAIYRNYVCKRRCSIVVYSAVASPAWLPNIASVGAIVWEKIPFSFVIDWFVPIGSYLAACSTARDISGKFVVTQSWEKTYGNIGATLPGTIYRGVVIGKQSYVRYNMTRTVTNTLPVKPPLADLLSKNQGYKSWRHAMNAVALLTGIFAKKGLVVT